ncbi:toll/interleukin-1 receptor domain-containing protein [Xanthobacter autotrophicus]|uniref:toll/interleukin-1 receptor domain-containing protein n=1 Tax=Xanthobacter TaxID=279 RepID=UPI0024AC71F1|nr:toll/interleukin-1 receptor domain-containing protein [Xanthobacter autotrophicus]MDI4665968.1 toll/interleukin-1 receptor domain-containing protein [Xanthobacter autotrophicus]
MAKASNNTVIFLSHAAADKDLVEAFETLLAKSLGITSENIFCSSLEGQGVPKGANFVEAIRNQVVAAKAVVALLTPAYLDSAFCMAELGAAWALNTHRLPIVVPPNTFKVMEATLLGIVGVSIDNDVALAQGFEDLCNEISLSIPTSGVRNRAMREFQRQWDNLSKNLKGPSRIEASVHNSIIRDRDEAIEARDAAEKELSKAEAKITALRKAKDAAAVAAIDAKFDDTDWKDRLDEAFDKIKDLYAELGGREIARLLILDRLGKFIRPDFQNYPDEAGRAVELDVYDSDGVKWNYAHPEVKELFGLVDQIIEIVEETPNDALKSKGLKTNVNNIRFWEEHI